MGDAQVALVNMPFSFSKYPSIQLGTLSTLLKSQGIAVDCHHLNVRFAYKIGVPLYELICEKRALFGEWLFSYLPTPGTVIYLGYGSLLREPAPFRFRRLDRERDSYFLKLSYLFRS